jgi:hypothetical protein
MPCGERTGKADQQVGPTLYSVNSETTPKRENYAGWIVGVGVLLLLAAGLQTAVILYRPLDVTVRISDGTTNQATWSYTVDGVTRTGSNTMPAKFTLRGRQFDITAASTVRGSPMSMELQYETRRNTMMVRATSEGSTLRIRSAVAGWNGNAEQWDITKMP